MPVHKVKGGYQWGNTGKVYKGKDAKKKAIKQAIAVAYSKARREGKDKPSKADVEMQINKHASNKDLNLYLLEKKAATYTDSELYGTPPPDAPAPVKGSWVEQGSTGYDQARVAQLNAIAKADEQNNNTWVNVNRAALAESAKRLAAVMQKQHPHEDRAVIDRLALVRAQESLLERATRRAHELHKQYIAEDGTYKAPPSRKHPEIKHTGDTLMVRNPVMFDRNTPIPYSRMSPDERKAYNKELIEARVQGRPPRLYTYSDRDAQIRDLRIHDKDTDDTRKLTEKEFWRESLERELGMPATRNPYTGEGYSNALPYGALEARYADLFPVGPESTPWGTSAPEIVRGTPNYHYTRDFDKDPYFDWSKWYYTLGAPGRGLYHTKKFLTKTLPTWGSNTWHWLKQFPWTAPPVVRKWE